jgi:uroporphyrinogen-III synthase
MKNEMTLTPLVGPITEQAAKEAGLLKLVVAKEYTTEGLIKVLNDLMNS